MADSEDHNSPFDSEALAYDSWFDGKGRIIFAIELQALKQVIPGLPKPWLEVGIGSGRFAQALGIEMGIDPSAALLEMAKDRVIKVFQAKGEDRFFEDESFGAVFLILSLCFVQSPIKVLREAHRILKPKGKLVLAIVPKESPWGRFYEGKKIAGHAIYEHAKFYSHQEVSDMLSDVGFSIERTISTLSQEPSEVKEIESPQDGYHANAGFLVIVAGKHVPS